MEYSKLKSLLRQMILVPMAIIGRLGDPAFVGDLRLEPILAVG